MNRNCNICNIEIDENIYLKDRSVCKTCFNKNRRKNKISPLIQNQQPKIDKINNDNDSTYENHAYTVLGPTNVGKTYYMLNVLEKIGNKRPIHIITRSPNQYRNYKKSTDIKRINQNTKGQL